MIKSYKIEENYECKVIGVDEAGRGPLAGPVVAAAIIINDKALEIGLNDSKKLSSQNRKKAFLKLTSSYNYGVGIVDAAQIDKIGILKATFEAMKQALSMLSVSDEYTILVDGNQKPFNATNLYTIIKGDEKCASIAAASIIAKVTRDEIMQEFSINHPEFDWHKNYGYGTANHLKAIKKYGITPYHRKTFLKFLTAEKQLEMNLGLKFTNK